MSSRRRAVANPEDDPYGSIGGSSTSGRVSFVGLSGTLLPEAVDTVTGRGHAVVLSRTSDGGAVSIGVLHDSLVTKFYAKSIEELDGLLRELAQTK